MNFEAQANIWLKQISERKKNPVSPATAKRYREALNTHILPKIGLLPLETVGNKVAKELVSGLTLAPASIQLVLSTFKSVVHSYVNDEGDRINTTIWNNGFIDVPEITSQKAPELPLQMLGKLMARSWGIDRALYALLAGAGLRISEALDLVTVDDGVSNFIDQRNGTVTIRRDGTKTFAGVRTVDLHPDLAALLSTFPIQGQLFNFSESTARRRMEEKIGIADFHRFRRFRATHLDKMNVPEGLKKFWLGHSNKGDITARYVKIGSDIAARKEWAVKAGLGFTI